MVVEFTDLSARATLDLDNWLNDVTRELIPEALPMFSCEELGEHALKLIRRTRTS
jgi:hypothetical protein